MMANIKAMPWRPTFLSSGSKGSPAEAGLEVGGPELAVSRSTINRIALELPSMRLREFSADGDGIATLVCAPLALHDATLTDFAPGHSLVAARRLLYSNGRP